MPAKKIILAITLSAISWAIILFLIYSASSCAPAPRAHYLSVTDIPSWAASPPNSDKYIYGVGYAKKQNPALGKAAAAERARTNISEQIEINISSMFLDFMHELGIGETVQAVEFTDRVTKAIKSDILTGTVIYALQNIEFNEQVTIQQTPNTLQGTVIEKTYIAKDGSVWVLVSFPIDNIIQNS